MDESTELGANLPRKTGRKGLFSRGFIVFTVLGIVVMSLLVWGLYQVRLSMGLGASAEVSFRVDSVSLNRIQLKDIVVESAFGDAEVRKVQTEILWEGIGSPRLGQIVVSDWSVHIPLRILVEEQGSDTNDSARVASKYPSEIQLPFEGLLMEEGTVDLMRWDRSVFRLKGAAEVRREVSSVLGTIRAANEQLNLLTSFKILPKKGDWSAQVGIKSTAPVEQYDFFREGLKLPELPAELNIEGIGPVQADGLLSQEGSGLLEQSWLAEGADLQLRWEDSVRLHLESWVGGATVEGSGLRRVDFGANVRSLVLNDLEADDFQLSGRLNEDERWSLELPQLKWRKGTDLSGGLAGRGFLEKKGEGIEGIDAETQLVFSHVQWGDYRLNPFRFFAGLKTGMAQMKLSPLSLTQWADWRLVAGAILWDETRKDGTVSAQLEYNPESRPILNVEVGVADKGEAGLSVRGQIDGEVEERLADFELMRTVEGAFEGSAQGVWDIAEAWPYLELFYAEALKIESGGQLSWKGQAVPNGKATPRIDFEIVLNDGLFRNRAIDKWAVQELNGSFKGSWTDELVTDGLQTVQIGKLGFGAHELSEVTISFRFEGTETLFVESVKGNWLGGTLRLGRFVVSPLNPDFSTQIYFEGIDAELLMAQFSEFKMRIVGQMDGSIPFSYRNGKVLPQRGHLKARTSPQAILFFEDEKQIAQYLRLPDAFEMKTKAMKAIMGGINIHEFAIDLFNPETPLQPILMNLEGSLKTNDIHLQGLNIKIPVRVDSADYMQDLQFLLGLFSGG